MKKWILLNWYKLMRKYARHQVQKLQDDILAIDYKGKIYKAWFQIFFLLWILERKTTPEVSIIHKTPKEMILKIQLNNQDYIYVPIYNYFGVIQNIIKIQEVKEDISENYENIINPQRNLDLAHRSMLKVALDKFGD